jgi:hypothetical protein
MLDPSLILDGRTFRPTQDFARRRFLYGNLATHRRHYRCHCGQAWRSHGCPMHDCVHLHQHFHVRHDMGSSGVDHCGRDLPAGNSIPRRGSIDCEQLVLELRKKLTSVIFLEMAANSIGSDHCHNNSLPGGDWQRGRQPGCQSLLPLGFTVLSHGYLYLLLGA